LDLLWFSESTKLILVQVLWVLSPVLLYQLVWANRTRPDARSHPVLGWLFAVAVIPCALFAVRTQYGQFDLQSVPLTLAILYGGHIPGLAAAATFAAYRVFTDPFWFTFLTANLPTVGAAFLIQGTGAYQRYSKCSKLLVVPGLLLIPLPILVARAYYTGLWGSMTTGFWFFVASFCVINLMAGVAVVHSMEFVIERLRLQSHLTELQKEANQEKRRLALEEMVISLAHEVKNPLTTVSGFVQLLRSRSPDAESQTYDLILAELGRVNSILNDFMSHARTHNKAALRPDDLNSVVEDLIPLITAQAEALDIVFTAALEPALPPVRLNPDHIKQLLLNLTQNAIDAMEPGGELTVRTYELAPSVLLEVTDTGQGIEEHHMDRLFDSFYTTKEKGAGLGLAICRRIVENHHASITVDSESGRGTTFTVRFPAARISQRVPS